MQRSILQRLIGFERGRDDRLRGSRSGHIDSLVPISLLTYCVEKSFGNLSRHSLDPIVPIVSRPRTKAVRFLGQFCV